MHLCNYLSISQVDSSGCGRWTEDIQHCSRQGVHTREGGEEEADSDADGSDVEG